TMKITRPSTFVELHVLFAPADLWNMKLNKVPAEATEGFISAGFIRVFPETTLQTLRGELGALLGSERSIHKFSFLKCVGRSLALVKSKQETDLKVKTFAPPYVCSVHGSYCYPAKWIKSSWNGPDSSYCGKEKTCWLRTDTAGIKVGHRLLGKKLDLMLKKIFSRDTWKKKYFETKKATTPLEEHLRNLRQELEIFYNKVLHQLQAREKARRPSVINNISKNELIIQIMRETQEIDNLKRKLEDSKMKLITEIKVNIKQAATELRDLKAELAQKKNQSSPSWMGRKHIMEQNTS
uniref:Spermatosis associated 1 n=1 Tax=Cyprinodon variegatus TaxID=28743 RepID=A0A3Q2DQQ7_CYPVA